MTWKTWTESLGSLEAPTTPSAFRESKASEFIWYNKLSSWMRHGRHGPKKNGRRNREFRTGEHLPISTSISDVYISTIWKAKLCPASFGELFSQLKFAGFHFRMGDLGAFWCIHFFGGYPIIPILTWNGASQNEDQESSCGLKPNIEYP
jgi:hypothetical protein